MRSLRISLPARLLQRHNRSDAGFTLLEVLIALSLAATLFGLMAGMIDGGRRLLRFGAAETTRTRQLELCFTLMRKELREICCNTDDQRTFIEAGAGVLAYATTRAELIARNEAPRGLVKVLWQHDPKRRAIRRTVVPILAQGSEALTERETWFLEDVAEFSVKILRDERWETMTGRPVTLPHAQAVGVELSFGQERKTTERIQTAFSVTQP